VAVPYTEQPLKLFRYSESCHVFKRVFESGSTLVRHRWSYVPKVPVALEVHPNKRPVAWPFTAGRKADFTSTG
jgi:hypothetical protein